MTDETQRMDPAVAQMPFNNDLKSPDGGRRWVAFFVFSAIALILAALDLFSKSSVFSQHFSADSDYQQPWWLIDGVFGVQVSFNRGALFGILPGFSWAFALISFVFIGILLSWLFIFGAWRDRWLTQILAIVTGGILGNLYDRLGLGYRPEYPVQFQDSVRDWILFRWEGVPFLDPWPNFNLADSYLVVGALLMLLHSFMQKQSSNTRLG